jgi:integrase
MVAEKQTVQQFLERWLEDVAKPSTRPQNLEQYEYAVRSHLVPALGAIPLGKLATQQIQTFLRTRTDAGLAARTVKHLRDVLRNALNVAVDRDLIGKNPAAKAKPPQVERAEVSVFNPEQARCFLATASGHRLATLFP